MTHNEAVERADAQLECCHNCRSVGADASGTYCVSGRYNKAGDFSVWITCHVAQRGRRPGQDQAIANYCSAPCPAFSRRPDP